jgi:hypothetical protein
MRRAFTALVACVLVSAVSGASVAGAQARTRSRVRSADTLDPWGGGMRTPRRISPRISPRVTAPLGRPPLTEVRRALRDLQPDVQRCALAHEPPGTGITRRLRMRVWLYPNGRWILEVPELTPARGRGGAGAVASRVAPNATPLRVCLQSALAARIQGFMRPFRARTREKVEQAYVVRMPGPPPSRAQLARLITGRRRQLVSCVPGSGARGSDEELVVRANLERDGHFTITGLGAPESAPFAQVVSCVQNELGSLHTDPVTSTAAVEVPIRFRYSVAAPAPGAPPAGGPAVIEIL